MPPALVLLVRVLVLISLRLADSHKTPRQRGVRVVSSGSSATLTPSPGHRCLARGRGPSCRCVALVTRKTDLQDDQGVRLPSASNPDARRRQRLPMIPCGRSRAAASLMPRKVTSRRCFGPTDTMRQLNLMLRADERIAWPRRICCHRRCCRTPSPPRGQLEDN